MRISTSFFYDQGLKNMLEQQARLLRVQDQLGQGVKSLSPSDDPSAAARVLGLNQSITQITQFGENTVYAKQRLELEESTLDSVNLVLQRVRELAVQAGNVGTGDQVTRMAITSELRQRIDEMMDLANTRDVNGDYLFSGFKSRTQPFATDGAGAYTYNGDQGQMEVKIGGNRFVEVSDSGAETFQMIRTGNGKFTVDSGLVNTGSAVMHQGSVINNNDYVAHDYSVVFRPEDENLAAQFVSTAAPAALDYSVAPETFDISINGGAVIPITFNQDMTGQSSLVISKAMAASINTQLGYDAVKGTVDTSGNMVLSTLDKDGVASSLTFSNLGATAAANLGLAALTVEGINSTDSKYYDVVDLTQTPGTVTSQDIGAAGVTIYDTDQPAMLTAANDVSTGVDFNTGGLSSFRLNVDGNAKIIELTGVQNAADVVPYIQAQIDEQFGEGVVQVDRNTLGQIELTTTATGSDVDIRVDNVTNNVLGFAANDFARGIDQNNQIKVYVDGSNDPEIIELTAGAGITAAAIIAEIDAAAGINAVAGVGNDIIINSDQLGVTNSASLLLQGNALETLGLITPNVTVGQTAREYTDGGQIEFDGRAIVMEGDPHGDDLYTVKASRTQDIFTTMQQLVDELEVPSNTEGDDSLQARLAQIVGNAIGHVNQAQDNVLSVRTGIGARLNSIESQEAQNFAQSNQLKKVRSDVVDLDYAEAISQLNFQLTALQAAQQSFAKVQSLSLFDFL